MDDATTEGTLLVPVANLETADRLLDTAVDIARDRQYEILVTYVVEVPAQLPLSEGDNVLDDRDEDTLTHAETTVEEAGVPVDGRIRYARDTARGIVGAAVQYEADLALLGWRGRPPRRDIVLGSYVDTVLRNAPCDVLVKRIRTPQPEEIESVLVPVAPGSHTRVATELAGAIARQHAATVTLVHVLPEAATEADRDTATELLDEAAGALGEVDTTQTILESDHVSGGITDETASHDVTVLGASERSLLRKKLLGTVSDAVGRHGAGTVMIAQRHPSKSTGQ